MTAFTVLISIILALVIWPLVNLSRNYIQARKIGLPILFSPIGRTNPLWMATERYLAPIFKYLSTLPFPFSKVFAFAHYSTNSWFFDLKHTIHLKYGPAFLIVTPADIQLILCDAAAVEEVCLRRKDFGKDPIMYKPLNIYGPNLVSANVDSWARHRRITTPPFNERNSSLVWKESLDQATGMLRSWAKRSKEDGGVSNTPNDTMTLALHVLTAAGFGKKYDFESGVQSVGEGQEMSYRDALKIVLRSLFRAIITSSLLMGLPGWAMPKSLLRMKSAVTAVGEYMTEMMQEERAIISERDSARDNLMSVLLRSSDNEGDGKERNVLSDEEILGNLFIYNVAGHDTTANTIAYAITLLALNREVQEWIGEELAGVFGSSGEQLRSYEEAFPKLKRCMAVMVSCSLHISLLNADLIFSMKRSAFMGLLSSSRESPLIPRN
jgi:cytochrome P450